MYSNFKLQRVGKKAIFDMNLTHFQFHYTHRLIFESEWLKEDGNWESGVGSLGNLGRELRENPEGAACFPMSNIIICTAQSQMCV